MTTDKKSKKSPAAKILEALPKSFEHSKMLQNAATLLHQIQTQASSLKDGKNPEVNKLIKKVKDSYEDLGSKVAEVSDEAKKQAKEGLDHLLKTWNTNKTQLPEKLTGEVDRLLDRVGLAKPKAKAKPATKAKTSTSAPKAKKATKPAAAKSAKPAKAAKPRTPKAPAAKTE
jgi:predicted phage tail protein